MNYNDYLTVTNEGMNVDANNIETDTLTSSNNKFNLDSNGNLTVNSLTINGRNNPLSFESIFDKIYPVGSVYISMTDVNPGTLFTGVWERVSQGRTLLGAGTPQPNSNNDFGALSSDQLSFNFMVGDNRGSYSHCHGLSDNGYAKITMHGAGNICYHELNTPAYNSNFNVYGSSGGVTNHTDYYGAGLGGITDFNWHVPPYMVVNIWKRVS